MLLLIRKNIFFSFLTLIFLPLIIMACFSITMFNKIEEFNANNLENNLNAIRLIYENSAKELENLVIQKANEVSLFNDTKIESKNSDNIDLLLIIDSRYTNNFGDLTPVLKQAFKSPVSSTEIIPSSVIKKYYKGYHDNLILRNNGKIMASLAHISACNIKNTDKILVGVRFLKLNSKLHKEISEIIKGKVLFIQKDYVIAEISEDKDPSKSTEITGKPYSSYYQTSPPGTSARMLRLFNKDHIYTIDPIYSYNKVPIGAIFLVKSQHQLSHLKNQNTALIIITILAIGTVIAVATYMGSRKLIDSFEQIAEVARAVKYGDLSKRVEIKAGNRIAQLGDNINRMIESLQDRESRIREYQREIHSQKEYLEALFNSIADGILTISKDCRITRINSAITIWSGLEEEKITRQKLANILECKCSIDCLNSREDISEICPLISQNERLAPTEAQILNTKTETEKLLSLNFSQVSGIQGEPTYVIVLRDITELKEVDQMRDDFIATLTHDLRVPILAEANTLKFFLRGSFGAYTDKQKEAVENMLESNNGLLSLVNSLLDTYKHESGGEELSREIVNIRKLAQDCVAELSPLARKNNQNLSNLIDREIPVIKVDKKEIKRVLVNLINNAITYTPKGGSIKIDAEKKEGEVLISVTDTGKGIPESERELIFDRFFSKAKKFRKIGTGLGLYLSKKIIERHNGKIWVESEPKKGSTFYISLPLSC